MKNLFFFLMTYFLACFATAQQTSYKQIACEDYDLSVWRDGPKAYIVINAPEQDTFFFVDGPDSWVILLGGEYCQYIPTEKIESFFLVADDPESVVIATGNGVPLDIREFVLPNANFVRDGEVSGITREGYLIPWQAFVEYSYGMFLASCPSGYSCYDDVWTTMIMPCPVTNSHPNRCGHCSTPPPPAPASCSPYAERSIDIEQWNAIQNDTTGTLCAKFAMENIPCQIDEECKVDSCSIMFPCETTPIKITITYYATPIGVLGPTMECTGGIPQ